MRSLLLPITTTFLILLLSPLAFAADVVLDTDGNPVQYGFSYYILPVVRGRGGGLTTNGIYIVQEQREVSLGEPVYFLDENNAGEGEISTSSNTKICLDGTANMLGVTHCNITYNYYVCVGKAAGLFAIEAEKEWYKLRHNSMNDMPSGDVGVILEDVTRYLYIMDGEPFTVMFKKCTECSFKESSASI